MYYIRKLSKPSNLQKIREVDDIALIPSDFLGQEMRTKQNTLSVWRCESVDELGMQDAINAALLASSEIAAAQFIILDSDMLESVGIKTCNTSGKTAYKGLSHLHTDLCDLTYEKIGKLLELYHTTSTNKDRSPKIEKREFQNIIIEAHRSDCLDESAMDEHLLKGVQKLIHNQNTTL